LSGILVSGQTDRGRVRDHNEDAWFADADLGLFIVADGLGGHAGGEVASDMVVRLLPSLLEAELGPVSALEAAETAKGIERAIERLNRLVCDRGLNQPELSGMGSTLVLAIIRKGRLLIAHVGDSRGYLLRNGRLSRLTRDHSLIQELLDNGSITPAEAAVHPYRAVVTQCIGIPGRLNPAFRHLQLHAGDRLLLCSDGLTNMLDDLLIADILGRDADAATVSHDLIQAANDAGGVDNITVVVVEMVDTG